MTSNRKERARLRRIETAQQLEQRGHVDHAVKEYLRAKAPGEAARALAKVGRLADAGAAIVEALEVQERGIAPLTAPERELVAQAVSFLDAGHEGAKAAVLREALAAAPPPPPTPEPIPDSEPPARASGTKAADSSRPPATKVSKESGSFRPPIAKSSDSFRPPATKSSDSFRPPATKSSDSFRPPTSKSSDSFRPPSNSGSFRPPSTGSFRPPSTGSFRPPSNESGSFRPPNVSANSFRPPARASQPPPSDAPDHSPRRPASTPVSRPAEQPTAQPLTRNAIHPRRRITTPAPPSSAPAMEAQSGDAVASILKTGSIRAPKITPVPTPPQSQPPREPARRPTAPTLSASGEEISEYSGSRASGWRGAGDEALERSIEDHLNAGRKGAAARIARDAGQFGRALAWFEEVGLHSQAGACLRALGRPAEALAMLLREEAVGPTYRKACFEIIAIAVELNKIGFDVDRFLTKFVSDGPADRDEVAAYFDLAKLYVAHELEGAAKRCLRKVLEADADHREAKALDIELRRRRRVRQSSRPPPRAIGLAATARGLPPLPSLKEFTELARANKPIED